MCKSIFYVAPVLCFAIYLCEVKGDLQKDIELQLKNGSGSSLARSRRYLVFPEGSSFQLVFDLAYPSIDGIGFFVYGNTAGLAWELPSTPIFLDEKFKKKKKEPEPPPTELPHLEHDEEDWHEIAPKIDHRGWQNKADLLPNRSKLTKFGQVDRSPVSSYSNPFDAYYKRNKGFDSSFTSDRNYYYRDNANSLRNNPWKLRNYQNQRNNENNRRTKYYDSRTTMGYADRTFEHNVHRRTRRDLYAKLEQFFSALIKDGKACILKLICQVNQTPKGKGTLFEELLKTVFEVKPDGFYENEDHYDLAANSSHNCEEMYPECKGNVAGKLLETVLYNNKRNVSR